jgi:putative transposase
VVDAVATKLSGRQALLKLLKKLLRRYGKLEIIVTNKLKSHGAAMKQHGFTGHECEGRWINNRMENSQQPLR